MKGLLKYLSPFAPDQSGATSVLGLPLRIFESGRPVASATSKPSPSMTAKNPNTRWMVLRSIWSVTTTNVSFADAALRSARRTRAFP